MLLPALLLRDHGPWGFVVFALPNVLGAAAMGWVLRSPQQAAAFAHQHRRAGLAFSLATMAFHLFVVGGLIRPEWNWLGLPLLASGLVVCGGLTSGGGVRGGFAASGLVLAVSFTALILASQLPGSYSAWKVAPALGSEYLWAFVPASLAGFLTCPYLDLTFLRARAATGVGTGRAAFVIGFCLVFAPMLLFATCYAHLMGPFFAGGSAVAFPGLWAILLPLHLVLQIALTLSFHGLEVARRLSPLRRAVAGLALVPALLLGCWCARLGTAAPLPVPGPPSPAWAAGWLTSLGTRMPWPEVGYRVFVILYGAVFPSYVLLCAWPTQRPTRPRFKLTVCAVVAGVTYGAGLATFVDQRPGGILVAVAALVVGRVLVAWGP